MAGMRAARPGAYEYEVQAAIEAVQSGRGAVSWSYPSIVGSGPNATILHYPRGERQMQSGELLLVDAACNYGYMAGDITRTYPVSGTFSPLQKDIYRIVLQAQEEAMAAARPGVSLQDVHNKTVEVIKAGLLKLGLITDTTGDQYQMWYHARRDAFPRHRRPRCRRPQASARGRHGVHDRTWHLHPPERARRAAQDAGEQRARRESAAGGDAGMPTSAFASKTPSFSNRPVCAACHRPSPGPSRRLRRS